MPRSELDIDQLQEWASREIDAADSGELLRSYMLTAAAHFIDAYAQIEKHADLYENYRRVQIQALLFNLGIVLSANSLPFLNVFSARKADPFGIDDEVTNRLTREPQWKGINAESERFIGGRQWIKSFPPIVFSLVFIERFLQRIQEIICSDKVRKKYVKTSDVSTKTVATALAAWIVQEFGVSNPVAIALAVGLMLLLANVARDTFCDEEVGNLARKILNDASMGHDTSK